MTPIKVSPSSDTEPADATLYDIRCLTTEMLRCLMDSLRASSLRKGGWLAAHLAETIAIESGLTVDEEFDRWLRARIWDNSSGADGGRTG